MNEMQVMPPNGATSNTLIGVGGKMTETASGAIAVQQSAAMVRELARMQMAISRPRNVLQSRDRIMQACMRESLAAKATYKYAKGGQDITGPSIRLAEVIVQNWGNMTIEREETERGNGYSMWRVSALDLETNAEAKMEFRVSHLIDTKKGKKIVDDERSIYELGSNMASRRLRACILEIIPGDIVEDAVEQCEKTLSANVGDDATFKKKVAGLLKGFKNLGISKEMVEARIQRHVEAMDRAQYLNLVQIGNSIKDGMSKAEDWFDMSLAPAEGDGGNAAKPEQPNGGQDGNTAAKPAKDTVADLNAKLGLKKGSDIAAPAKKDEPNATPPPATPAAKPAQPANGTAAAAKPATAAAKPATAAAPAAAKPAQPAKKDDPNSLF